MTRKRLSLTWRRKAVLIAAPPVMVAAALIVFSYLQPPPRLLTDGRDIQVLETAAPVRRVLWTEPRLLDLPLEASTRPGEIAVSPAGDELYFTGRLGPFRHLFVSYFRKGQWTPPLPLNALNSQANQVSPHLSPDGKWLLFSSDRPGGLGGFDLYAARRTRGGWSAPFNLGRTVNSPADEIDPALSPDGQRLLFASNRFAAQPTGRPDPETPRPDRTADFDLFESRLTAHPNNHSHPWKIDPPQPLEDLNSPAFDGCPAFSPRGDFLYLASARPGGLGRCDLYRCRLLDDRFSELENLGRPVNSSAEELSPALTMDGFVLWLASSRPNPAADPADSSTPQMMNLWRCESREVFVQPVPQPSLLANWAWWALAGGMALLVALALYIYEGGYRRLDLLKKCLLLSLALHVLITVLLSLIMVSQDILEIVAPDAGITTAVNLNQADEIEVKLQTRKTLTDMPVKVPQLNPASMPVPVAVADQPAQVQPPDLPRAQVQPGQMTIVRPVAPLSEPAHSAQAVAVQPLDFFAATPKPIEQPPQPLKAVEKAQQPQPAPRQPPSQRHTVSPLAQAQPQLPPLEAQPTRPVELALLPSPNPIAPHTRRVEHLQPNAPRLDQPMVNTQSAQTVKPLADTHSPRPSVQAPTGRIITMASSAFEPQPQAPHAAAPPTRPDLQSLVTAHAVTPRIDLPSEVMDIALPDSQVGPELDMPRFALLREDEPPRRAPQPTATDQPYQPRRPSDQPLAAAEPVKTDPLLLKPVRAAEQTLPVVDPDLKLERQEPPLLIEPASPRLYTAPITIAEMPPGELASPTSLFQRSLLQRPRLLAELGGTPVSEATVERALHYLARIQEPDGRWTYVENQGRATRKSRGDRDAALTGLACLCFLASDHTPDKPGPFQAVIDRGLDFLLSIQKSTGDLRFRDKASGMYSHAIATLALAEAAIMTGNPTYRQAALRAAAFIIDAQNHQTGGWRYLPGQPGDTSVFGWQIMALHSCEQLGLDIPPATREGAIRWLVSVSDRQHGILSGYQKPAPTAAMTAQAVFSRILLGEPISPQRRATAAGYLLRQLPSRMKPVNYYYAYYGSMCMLQLGGAEWQQWNQATRDYLIGLQIRGGPLDGSWDYRKSRWGAKGGRVYATAMATLTLQVYYRYLPMYKNRPIRR